MATTINTTGSGSAVYTDFTGLKAPRNLSIYNRMKGISDFGNLAQYDLYETGYPILVVLSRPKFIEALCDLKGQDSINQNSRIPSWIANNAVQIKNLLDSFCDILEYEFRGIDGLPDVTTDTSTISDGINEMNMITKVTQDTSVQVSMSFFEKSGSLITKFLEFYIKGIKDSGSLARSYYGLVNPFATGSNMEPGYENEVFTMLYMATDNTYMRLEKAYLLLNCQFTTANTSMYENTKGDIGFKEISVQMNCFPVSNRKVNLKATEMLEYLMTTTSNDGYCLISDDFDYTGSTDKAIYSKKYESSQGTTNDLIATRISGNSGDTAGGWRATINSSGS